MKVELLVVPDCPNEAPAAALLRSALDDIGMATVRFEVTVIDSLDSAQQRGFVGSPTFLLDGDDPFAVPGEPVAVSCRLYGGPDCLPAIRDLRQALKRAAFEGARP